MPLSRIEIEETAAGRAWVAEVEIGRGHSRRKIVKAASFDNIMCAIIETYRAAFPRDPVVQQPIAEQPIDHSIEPVLPGPPLGKDGAMQKRRGRPPANR